MDPITIGLLAVGAASKIAGIVGAKKRKQINPNELRQLFGAKAITDEQMELFNRAINSTQGQQLMTSAAQEGQQMQTDVARRAAEAGLGPSGGATGGADIFAGAAADSAQGNLQRSMQSSLMQAMLPMAQQLVSDRMQAWLGDREKVLGQTTKFQDIMGAVSGLSGDLVAAKQTADANKSNKKTTTGKEDTPQTSANMSIQQPAGTAPMAGAQAPGTQAMVGPSQTLAMPNPLVQANMPGARQRQMRDMLSGGGGRFARAMSASNRFGAVQSVQ